jgi:hypothetical protein
MSLPDYRDTFVRCLGALKDVINLSDDYVRFSWQAVYLTRERFSYFFRGTLADLQESSFGQQIDLTSGDASPIPFRSVTLYGATFGLNEAITAYSGPTASVIDVAHAFHEASEMDYRPEFFYVRMNILRAGNEGRIWRPAAPHFRENTNLIFVGLEDSATAELLEESDIARCLATEQPMASRKWYAERFYYS